MYKGFQQERRVKMNNTFLSRLFIIIITSPFCLHIHSAEIIPLDNNMISKNLVNIEVLESSESTYRAKVKIHGIIDSSIPIGKRTFHQLSFGDDYGSLMDIGKPDLPTIHHLVPLPKGASYDVSITDVSYREIGVGLVYPAQEEYLDTENSRTFTIDSNAYQNEFVPNFLTTFDNNEWRGSYYVNVCVCPFKYSPVSGTLQVAQEFIVNVLFHHGDNESGIQCLPKKINRESGTYDYLIIAGAIPGILGCDALKDFRRWKSMKGLKTKLVSTSAIGTSCNSIKSYIAQEYQNGVRYVLLVGNASFIPPREIKPINNTVTSDYWYGCMGDSTDYLADIAIGRFSVRDTADLKVMVDKTLAYESQKNDSCRNVLLVAHEQDAPERFQGCMEEVRTGSYDSQMHFSTAYGAGFIVGGDCASNADVINATNLGLNIVNYRGHGLGYRWSAWNVNNENFDSISVHLLNPPVPPVVFSIACKTADISNEPCLMESFMRFTKGSVAYLGATESTRDPVNNRYNKLLYNKLLNDTIYQLGDVNNAALFQNITSHPNSPYYTDNAFCYLVGGDPSLELWTDCSMDFQRPNIELVNGSTIGITSTITGYRVSLVSENGQLLNTSICNGGNIQIPLPSENVWIAFNKHNYVPYTAYINVTDKSIQDKTFTYDNYYLGGVINVGSDVTSIMEEGSVVVEEGSRLVIKTSDSVSIKNDFEIEEGAELIIK